MVSPIFKRTLFLLVCSAFVAGSSQGGSITWKNLITFVKPPSVNSIIYADGKYFAVGDSGIVLISPDGIRWSGVSTPTQNALRSVAWAQTTPSGVPHFTAVGDAGAIVQSLDGLKWFSCSGGTKNLRAVAWGNNMFLAVGDNQVLVSQNGAAWTPSAVSSYAGNLRAIIFADSQFAAVGDRDSVFLFSKGNSVQMHTISSQASSPHRYSSIAWGNKTFVVFDSTASAVLSSSDGVVWDMRLNCGGSSISRFSNIAWTGSSFVFSRTSGKALDIDGSLYSSADGRTWPLASQTGLASIDIISLASDGSSYAASAIDYRQIVLGVVSSDPTMVSLASLQDKWKPIQLEGPSPEYSDSYSAAFWQSDRFTVISDVGRTSVDFPNGMDFEYRNAAEPFQKFSAMVVENTILVKVGGDGKIATSTDDGKTWTVRTSGTTANLNAITFGKRFVVAADSGIILTSDDAVTWTRQSSQTNASLFGITWDGSQYIALGNSGTILTSPDGTSWSKQVSNTSLAIRNIVKGGNLYVAVGDSGLILSTPDLSSWSTVASGTGNNLSGIAYGNGMFAAAGAGGTIITSANGSSWDLNGTATTQSIRAIAFGNNRFLAAGYSVILLSDTLTHVGVKRNKTNTSQHISFSNGLLQYSLLSSASVRIALYDIRGRLIRTLVSSELHPGEYTLKLPRGLALGSFVLSFAAGSLTWNKNLFCH